MEISEHQKNWKKWSIDSLFQICIYYIACKVIKETIFNFINTGYERIFMYQLYQQFFSFHLIIAQISSSRENGFSSNF